MNCPKVVVVGAGSYFFARPVIWNMVNSPVLRGGTQRDGLRPEWYR